MRSSWLGGGALVVTILLVSGCGPQQAEEVGPADSSSEAEDTTVAEDQEEVDQDELEEVEEEEEEPKTTMSALGRRLRSNALHDSLDKLFLEYAPRPFDTGDGKIMVIEFTVGTGGNVGAVLSVAVDDALSAQTIVEECVYVLCDDNQESVDKAELVASLEEAKVKLNSQYEESFAREQNAIQWIQQQESSEISTEGTVRQTEEKFDFYRGCLEKAVAAIEDVLEELPAAVPG